MIRMIRFFANHANHMIHVIRKICVSCESYDSRLQIMRIMRIICESYIIRIRLGYIGRRGPKTRFPKNGKIPSFFFENALKKKWAFFSFFNVPIFRPLFFFSMRSPFFLMGIFFFAPIACHFLFFFEKARASIFFYFFKFALFFLKGVFLCPPSSAPFFLYQPNIFVLKKMSCFFFFPFHPFFFAPSSYIAYYDSQMRITLYAYDSQKIKKCESYDSHMIPIIRKMRITRLI